MAPSDSPRPWPIFFTGLHRYFFTVVDVLYALNWVLRDFI